MRQLYHQHKEKINYLLVGGWNTLFGYCVFVGLYFWLGKQMNYIALLLISNVLSITNAYIGYKIFVFRTEGNIIREYLRFYLVYAFSIVLNLLLLFLMVEWLRVNPIPAQGVVMWFTILISFIGHKYVSFKNHG